MTTLESLQTEIELLNKKMDLIIELLKPKKEIKVLQEKTWELTEYKNSILVSFAFNLDFKEYIKQLGGKWMVSKKSWMFPKAESESIIEQISEKFPDWKKL
jgi:hypothetical protein